jgi:predicted MPP superfamily phosphohydrolase
LQTDQFGDYERRVLRRVMAERPDLILLAGDYLQCECAADQQRLSNQLRAFLKEIDFSAPLGVFAVRGNVEQPDWAEMFEGLPITIVEETQTLGTGEVTFTGLSCGDSFSTRADIPATDRFHIVLGHSPNYALQTEGGDLLLSGHTHGGQVRLPGIGPLMTGSRVPRSWAAGSTTLAGDRTLYVSRGVGHERWDAPRLRFLCRPELVMITIRPGHVSVENGELE